MIVSRMCGICGELSFDGRARCRSDGPRGDARSHRSIAGPITARRLRLAATAALGLGFRRLRSSISATGGESADRQRRWLGPARLQRRDLQLSRAAPRSRRARPPVPVERRFRSDRAPLRGARRQVRSSARRHVRARHLGRAAQARLTLARDRAGKKPLFSIRTATRVAVRVRDQGAPRASRPSRSRSTTTAVPYYFLYGYVPHPQTFYRGVTQVEPGTRRRPSIATAAAPTATLLAADLPVSRGGASSRATAAGGRRARARAGDRRRQAAADERCSARRVPQRRRRFHDHRRRDEPAARRAGATFSIGFEGDAAFDETAAARRDRRAVRHGAHRVPREAVGDRPARYADLASRRAVWRFVRDSDLSGLAADARSM